MGGNTGRSGSVTTERTQGQKAGLSDVSNFVPAAPQPHHLCLRSVFTFGPPVSPAIEDACRLAFENRYCPTSRPFGRRPLRCSPCLDWRPSAALACSRSEGTLVRPGRAVLRPNPLRGSG